MLLHLFCSLRLTSLKEIHQKFKVVLLRIVLSWERNNSTVSPPVHACQSIFSYQSPIKTSLGDQQNDYKDGIWKKN